MTPNHNALPGAARKLYVHADHGGATVRLVVPRESEEIDHTREAREILELLERFLPRPTFDALLELCA